MIKLKNDAEIDLMIKGGAMLKETLDYLINQAQPGLSLLTLDKMAEEKIISLGGESSFKRVPDYYWTCCFSLNDGVVHGIPTDYKLKNGDKIGIDCGVYYKGFHTDSAWSIIVGDSQNNNKSKPMKQFLEAGKKALFEAIKMVKPGNHIGHISRAIQENVEKTGYSVVRNLTGHGVGRDLHEEPEIPGILRKNIENTPLIKEGMVLAVEVIYNLGSPDVVYKDDDGWTIVTKDGKISGLFEKTVAVRGDGVFVLT